MTTALNLSPSQVLTSRRAASLRRTVEWKVRGLWGVLQRISQRRAAPELARVARRIAETQPEAAAHLLEVARQWRAS